MTYWDNKGRFTPLYEELATRLVPEEGRAPTPHGELLSATSRIYYDWFNNGGCNLDNPRFQLALYTIRDWSEEIDEKVRRLNGRDWPGTWDMLDRPIRWSQSEGSPRDYGLNDKWSELLELLVDAVVQVVKDADERNPSTVL